MIDLYIDNSPVRKIEARVEVYSGYTLAATYSYTDALKSVDIERVGEDGKFFGFGISQKANIKLLDINRNINISTDNYFKVYFNNDYITAFPSFYVTEVNRNENTNELSITGYDLLYAAADKPITSLALNTSYSSGEILLNFGSLMGCGVMVKENITNLDLWYENGANFEGSETLREALTALAELTQSIYYIDSSNCIMFKKLDKDGEAVLTIDKDNYYTLDASGNRRLSTIVNATELGDNISATTGLSGSTQYIRDNPFLELREDVPQILEAAVADIGGITIGQFDCSWRGNPALEIGDKLALVTKNGDIVYSYLLNDTISYNGAFSEVTKWAYAESEKDENTVDNPTTIGEALKQTYARVDKAEKQIDIVASAAEANTKAISALQINTESISASVKSIEENTLVTLDNLQESVGNLTQEVEAKVSADNLSILVKEEIAAAGVDSVTTTTGFTFNEDGLTVDKSGSDTSTRISEDGLSVYRDSEEVLTANNEGVKAEDLHATTFLIIGTNSRFENYGDNRTGCFWIGE